MLRPYKKAGRWTVRIYGPWVDLNEAFRRGLAEDSFFKLGELDNEEGDETDEQIETSIKLYRSVLALVPNFEDSLKTLDADYMSITELIKLVRCLLILPHLY